MKKEVSLQAAREPLQVPYPQGFQGDRSTPVHQTDLYVSGQPVALTEDEITFVQEYLKSLPYKQSLIFGATILDAHDPLLAMDHNDLDQLEATHSLPNTRKAKQGGERSTTERALIIREAGFRGTLTKALAAAP